MAKLIRTAEDFFRPTSYTAADFYPLIQPHLAFELEHRSGKGSASGAGHPYSGGSSNDINLIYNPHGLYLSSYQGEKVYTVDQESLIIVSVRGNVARAQRIEPDFTLTPCYVVKYEHLFACDPLLREAELKLYNKRIREMDIDSRIDEFLAQIDITKPYPAKTFYEWHNRLTDSCEPGRKTFFKYNNLSLESDQEYTIEDFIDYTKNERFGGIIIQKLEEKIRSKKP